MPQPRGQGRLEHLREPTTGRGYYLYLPRPYLDADEATRAAGKWPLVVTFHGMKPYDVAYFQACEWEAEADRYGYIVIAPELRAFAFIFGEFPLRHRNAAFLSDERATLAIIDHVVATTHADERHVLATGFSSGGYAAHYMLNQHPDRFSCLAVRQSNFSASVLDPGRVQASRRHPVLVLGGERDIGVCKHETAGAIAWYQQHGYERFAWAMIGGLGHERTPDLAALFFARSAGIRPRAPCEALARRRLVRGNEAGLSLLAGEPREPAYAARSSPPADAVQPYAAPDRAARDSAAATTYTAPGGSASVPPPAPHPPDAALVHIELYTSVGYAPLILNYTADCPSDWYATAKFDWFLGSEHVGSGINGQRTLVQPGDHVLSVRVRTPDGREHRAERRIRVLRQPT